MGYLTIRCYSRKYEMSESLLRARLKQHLLPGFYSGNRFLIDEELFSRLLREESQESYKRDSENKALSGIG